MARTASEDALEKMVLQKFDELVALVGATDDATANRTLPVEGSNSVVQILVHCCGMMRRWISTVNLGREVPRDRDAEFTSSMTLNAVESLANSTRAACQDDLSQTVMQSSPALVPSGREHYWTTTCEGVLLHVLEELCQHLGQAEVTRDVLMSCQPTGD